MRTIRRVLAVLFLVAAPAAAQAPDPAILREQLMQFGDTAALLRLERDHARAQQPIDVLTAGFAALRLADITGDRDHARRARRYFDRLAEREPHNAWAHYGHALSFRLDIAHVPGPHDFVIGGNASAVLGFDARSRARRALERAVTLDPWLPGAITLLAQYAAETRDRESLEQVRTVLTARHTDGRASAEDLATLASTLRTLGDYDAAIDVMRQSTSRASGSSAASLFELARALAHRPAHELEAGAAYLRALAAADDSLLSQLWRDVEIIARDAEKDDWQDAEVEQRRALLRRFWNVRAALAGVAAAERIAEHYRRIDYATSHFSRRGKYGAPSTNSLVWSRIDDRFDDRGVIYIRHGQPLDIVLSTGAGRATSLSATPWESWAYRIDSGETVMYHFAKFPPSYSEGGSTDFVLVNNVDCGVVDDQHIKYDQRLKRLAFRCNALERRSVGASVRSDARKALRTDSYRPALTVALAFNYDFFAFRGTSGSTLVTAAFGFPLARLDRDRALRFTFAVADTATGTLARTEAVTPTHGRTEDPAQLRTQLGVEVEPSRTALYRVSLFDSEDHDVGMMYGGPLRVLDFRGDTLMLSDIVIAEPTPSGSFARGAHSFSLAPSQTFDVAAFRVFYEIYNIAPAAKYQTEISVEPIDGGLRATIARLFGKRTPVVLAFGGVAPSEPGDGVIQEVRDVTAALPPGRYRLKISVKQDGARHALVRERQFTIAPGPDRSDD